MNTSIFLAQAFGVYMLVMGVVLLYRRGYVLVAASDLVQSKGAYFLLGVVTLILGILLVLSHNLWVADWRVVITILSWIVFLKGMSRLLFASHLAKWVEAFKHPQFYYSTVVVLIAVGLYLVYKGFM